MKLENEFLVSSSTLDYSQLRLICTRIIWIFVEFVCMRPHFATTGVISSSQSVFLIIRTFLFGPQRYELGGFNCILMPRQSREIREQFKRHVRPKVHEFIRLMDETQKTKVTKIASNIVTHRFLI